MIDPQSDTLISLTQLATRLGKDPSAVWRWTLKGLRGHKLERIYIGRRCYTTFRAFEEWQQNVDGGTAPVSLTPSQRVRDLEAAERELEAMLGKESSSVAKKRRRRLSIRDRCKKCRGRRFRLCSETDAH